MSVSSGWAERMPWQRSAAIAPADDAEPDLDEGLDPADDRGDAAFDDAAFADDTPVIAPEIAPAAAEDVPAADPAAIALPDGIEPATAESWARQSATPEGRREALSDIGVHMSEEYAERAGLDIDPAGVDATVRALATDEGRAKAMRELGVHMSGNLAERYGVEDAEAERLLEASRALRTPEGRRELLAEYTDGADSDLMHYLTGRGASITDRREAVQRLLSHGQVRSGIARAGRGLLVGGIILVVVLVGVLIGAVALLGGLVDGGSDAAAHAAQAATRPTVGWIGVHLSARVM